MKIEKVKNMLSTCMIKEYVIHIRSLKQALNHGLVLKKLHRVIKFNQEAWLKPLIINTDLREDAKNCLKEIFFKLMNNAMFGKSIKNVREHRDIKRVTIKARRKYLVSKPNYHIKFFFQKIY